VWGVGSIDKSAFPDDLQDLIGYRFHNEKILEDAMTCRAGEPPAPKKGCTEPLAAVGDAILDAVVTCRLYEEMTQVSGEITVLKPEDVKRDRTRSFAEKHQIMRYVRNGQEMTQDEIWMTGIRQNDRVTEALVGAVFVDAERRGRNGFIIVKKSARRPRIFLIIFVPEVACVSARIVRFWIFFIFVTSQRRVCSGHGSVHPHVKSRRCCGISFHFFTT
jgi:hypothetical protein